jgi:hypothetical protein
MTAVVSPPEPSVGGAQQTVRRVIMFALLFATTIVAANGIGGLLGRLFDLGSATLAANDVSSLALWRAFTFVGGPLAVLFWWWSWRRLNLFAERSSSTWGLYLAGIATVALITASANLLQAAAALVRGEWRPSSLGIGVAWAGGWAWHRWMSAQPAKSPTRFTSVAPVLGAVFGLAIGVGGTITAVGLLLDAVVHGFSGVVEVGDPWWRSALQALVWAIGGAAIWWWHWAQDGARTRASGLAVVVLVITTGFASVIVTLGGIATTLFMLLRVAFDHSQPAEAVLYRVGTALAAAAVGAVVWAYFRGRVRAADERARSANRLVTSGVILAAVGTPLAQSGGLTLLLGGISAVVVGAPAWWLVWRPAAPLSTSESAAPARRIYLIAVFGASAIVALVTLLVIGFRVFEFTLADVTGVSLLDRVRAPLGLLIATGLASGYHFTVWRMDRTAAPSTPHAPRRIGRVVLVTASDPEPLCLVIERATGAVVTVWPRVEHDTSAPPAERLTKALEGIVARRVLVLAGPGDRLDVIPLRD